MRERDVFIEVLQHESAAARADYLDAVCAGDVGFRRRVEQLLAEHARQESFFLDSPPPGFEATQLCSVSEQPGMQIGPYKLLQQIGEGGFGVVLMAEQTAPVRRKVAIKIIKPGMDTQQVVARFEAERQALAVMDHPNIARVFDAGTTDSGRPYFVMELVHGVPITDYCDAQKLTSTERLRLMLDVCRAVQHAHQKGIIHRDLKPSNVMVTMHDDKPVPKIIDFGVAKAISHQLTEKTLFTAYGQMVGTPMYMSPEQTQLSGLDVDTRSDVYALGVLLYELVAGSPPFEEATLRSLGFDEWRRMIREQEPLPPSARVGTLKGDRLSTVADQRQIEPRRLIRALSGEVDWIVMKALEKDRNRRYESANALGQDIERYLHDEPVQACPPSTAYRLRKFARRNRIALAIAGTLAGVLLLAVAGLTVSSILVWRANSAARRLTYFQRVALAEREWAVSNFKRADELLALCPSDLRGWEWNYVKRLRSGQIATLRHDGPVADCAVSPDGTRIVSLEWAGSVHCWDAASGRELWPPVRGHERSEGVVSDVVFSPDGQQFATTGWNDIKVWDARSGEQRHVWITPEPDSLYGLAYAAGGRLMTCICLPDSGQKIHTSIWNVMTGVEMFPLPQIHDRVLDMAVSPDGRTLALACVDNTIHLADADTGRAIRTMRGDRSFWCVSFSPDGTLVAAGTGGEGERDSGTVRIWDVASGRERVALTGHGAQCIAFSPDGQRLATGGSDQSVKIWDIASGQEILTLRGHTDFIQGIAFTPDGHRLVSSGERTVRIWDGSPWRDSEHFGDDAITLRGHTDSVNAIAFGLRSTELFTAGTDGNIKCWSTKTWHDMWPEQSVLEGVTALAMSPRGDRLAVSGYHTHQDTPVVILDAATGAELQRLGDLSGNQAIAFGADGRQLVIGNDNGSVTIHDVATGSAVRQLQAPGKFPYRVTFSPDDKLLAICHDERITIWDAATGREIDASPLRHQGFIYSLAFSPDGRYLASGGWDRSVRVWETSSWKPEQVIFDTAAVAGGVVFGPDGRCLAWGATDSTVKLWNRATDELHTLRGHLGNVRCVAFSPDGKWIASGSEDGTAKIWRVPGVDATP